jgi:hypothetical protein
MIDGDISIKESQSEPENTTGESQQVNTPLL